MKFLTNLFITPIASYTTKATHKSATPIKEDFHQYCEKFLEATDDESRSVYADQMEKLFDGNSIESVTGVKTTHTIKKQSVNKKNKKSAAHLEINFTGLQGLPVNVIMVIVYYTFQFSTEFITIGEVKSILIKARLIDEDMDPDLIEDNYQSGVVTPEATYITIGSTMVYLEHPELKSTLTEWMDYFNPYIQELKDKRSYGNLQNVDLVITVVKDITSKYNDNQSKIK